MHHHHTHVDDEPPPRGFAHLNKTTLLVRKRRPAKRNMETTGKPQREMDGTDEWHIHGRIYNLRPFASSHPGGAHVLMNVRGTDDLTALYETSHALVDRDKIDAIMKKYYVRDAPMPSAVVMEDDGFYRVLVNRIRTYCRKTTTGHRATPWWWCKSSLLLGGWLAMVGQMWYSTSTCGALAAAVLAGMLNVSVGFVVMHDASHSALSGYPVVHEQLARWWCALSLWDDRLWFKHHVHRHHSFTGDHKLDPDVLHLMPFIRKHSMGPPSSTHAMPPLHVWQLLVFLLHCVPGMFVGQIIAYARWWSRGRLWRMAAVETDIDWLGGCIRWMVLGAAITHPLLALAYFGSANTTYAIMILPDHDTERTRAVTTNATKNADAVDHDRSRRDWGVNQVHHSGNFATSNPLVCMFFGGINYQIEHHLFPTMCHVHYPSIQPIVRATCREFGVVYNEYPTIWSAYASALRAIVKGNA